MYEYKAIVKRVVDGDTVDLDIDLGFGIWMHRQRIRLEGVDAPESRTRDLIEKAYGMMSKEFVRDHCPVGHTVIVHTNLDDRGKFGRILGRIMVDEGCLNDMLIENHHAVAYEGQSKEAIAEAHMNNRAALDAK